MSLYWQTNGYNCGVMVVINAYNFSFGDMFDHTDIPLLETMLECTPEYGTDEKLMVPFLRELFTVKLRKTLDINYLKKWLKEGNQAIILYRYSVVNDEWHFANIFQEQNGIFRGMNFWSKVDKKWKFHDTMDEKTLIRKMKVKKLTRVLYIKKKKLKDVIEE